LSKPVENNAQGNFIAPDNFLWTGTEGQYVSAIQGDYVLRIGIVGRRTYWNLYYKDTSVRNGNTKSFSEAKMNCIEAYQNHCYGG